MIFSPFPRPLVLEKVSERLRVALGPFLQNWGIISVQHLLGTTGSLVKELLNLGLEPQDLFILGKHYSTNQTVFRELIRLGVNARVNNNVGRLVPFSDEFDGYVREMWERVTAAANSRHWKGILILDDGGHCISTVPGELCGRLPIAGIEQTTSGITRVGHHPPIPVVNVALSAAKTKIEASLISETVVRKIKNFLPARQIRAGVIGLGNIGGAIARSLQAPGNELLGYDLNMTTVDGVGICHSADELIESSEFIFGCTGEDATGVSWIPKVTGRKVFLSCSSEDREFRELLTWLRHRKPSSVQASTDEIEVRLPKSQIVLVRGGFPVNFDRAFESVPADDIQVTRSLLLGGIAQAAAVTHASGYLRLDSSLQRFIIQEWIREFPLRTNSYGAELIRRFDDVDWISAHSAGSAAIALPRTLFHLRSR